MEHLAIDRSLPAPLYLQVSERLQQLINSGTFQIGDELPPEGDLAEHYQVSRSVVRQAMSSLVTKGMIETRKGRPAAVIAAAKQRSGRDVSKAGGLAEELEAQGKQLFTSVISIDEAPAPDFFQERLLLHDCWEIHRLRFVDDQPIMYVINWVPKSMLPHLSINQLQGESLHALIRQTGVTLTGGKRFMTAVKAEDFVAKALRVNEGDPLLQVTGETRTTRNYVAEGFKLWHHPSFELEINASANGDADDHHVQEIQASLLQLQDAISGAIHRDIDILPKNK